MLWGGRTFFSIILKFFLYFKVFSFSFYLFISFSLLLVFSFFFFLFFFLFFFFFFSFRVSAWSLEDQSGYFFFFFLFSGFCTALGRTRDHGFADGSNAEIPICNPVFLPFFFFFSAGA